MFDVTLGGESHLRPRSRSRRVLCTLGSMWPLEWKTATVSKGTSMYACRSGGRQKHSARLQRHVADPRSPGKGRGGIVTVIRYWWDVIQSPVEWRTTQSSRVLWRCQLNWLPKLECGRYSIDLLRTSTSPFTSKSISIDRI